MAFVQFSEPSVDRNPDMSLRFLLNYGALSLILVSCAIIILSFFLGPVSSAVVTLESMEIYNTHEWLKMEPTVYFLCQGENKTILSDVKEAHVPYNFTGLESWQPLTNLSSVKCKRCGFYEADIIKTDDVFDEWELCPLNFKAPHGIYSRFKDKEFNATFICPDCARYENGTSHVPDFHGGSGRLHAFTVIMIITLISVVSIVGALIAYKHWHKRKREQKQGRFQKKFENYDIEKRK